MGKFGIKRELFLPSGDGVHRRDGKGELLPFRFSTKAEAQAQVVRLEQKAMEHGQGDEIGYRVVKVKDNG